MKTVAYLRVSTRSQDLANQINAILEFSQKRLIPLLQRKGQGRLALLLRIGRALGTPNPE